MVDIEIPRTWDAKNEHKFEHDDEFMGKLKGYFLRDGRTVYVGYVTVLERHRGRGLFKALLNDWLKQDADVVVLLSPTFMTRRLAERYGYGYWPDKHCLVWDRYNAKCCWKSRKEAVVIDPFNKMAHTKDCVNKEIDWLVNNCAPHSLHAPTGLTIRERIDQLATALEESR